jgi:hypothetical protein
MLLPILLIAGSAVMQDYVRPQPFTVDPSIAQGVARERYSADRIAPNACYTMRTYVFSQEQNPKLEKVLNCVPVKQNGFKRAHGAVKLVPIQQTDGKASSK